ncbi:heavy metal-associated isoprenylated plant protein 2-like [Nymphaea colorata]|uniref:heavy metal-associated isoprenylated plant protein 2-like n=1 Tax=Nymphaea colorata TaxID=210225 RepID=UPI00129E8B8B|nr:heavy metal-associated isoprenylated plant protein 2-like [Nymphaea colorata]
MGASGVLKIVLKVEFHCLKCKVLVMKTISTLMGIDKIEIDAEKSTVTVTGEVDPVAVVKQVRKIKKMVEIVTVGPPPKPEPKPEPKPDPKPCDLPTCCRSCEHISVTVERYGGCTIM